MSGFQGPTAEVCCDSLLFTRTLHHVRYGSTQTTTSRASASQFQTRLPGSPKLRRTGRGRSSCAASMTAVRYHHRCSKLILFTSAQSTYSLPDLAALACAVVKLSFSVCHLICLHLLNRNWQFRAGCAHRSSTLRDVGLF